MKENSRAEYLSVMLKETYTEHLAIVRAIAAGDTGAWPDDCAALTAVLARLDALETENRRLRKHLERFTVALPFAQMSSILKPSPDAKWSLGWWYGGRFIAVFALGQEDLEIRP